MESFTDEELAELAMAADPDRPVDADAVPFGSSPGDGALLPEWYMPVPGSIRRTRPRVVFVLIVVASLVIGSGAGLCVTSGLPEIAW